MPRPPLARAYLNWIGRIILSIVRTIHGLGAFALITLAVTFTKFWKASGLVHPMILLRSIAPASAFCQWSPSWPSR
jgi:hypothetical protein